VTARPAGVGGAAERSSTANPAGTESGSGTRSGRGHRHSHAGGVARSAQRSRRLAVVVLANLAIAGTELAGGVLGHSMALLSDAGHNATDVLAAGLALAAVHLARRPPNARKSYGYHRSGVLAAQANGAAVLVLSVLMVVGAALRLAHPEHVHPVLVLVIGAIALLLNGGSALLLATNRDHDLNMRGTLLHMAADAASSAGVVVVGAVLLAVPSLEWLDPAVSLGIALMVGYQAVHLGLQVVDVLLEGTPEGTEPSRVRQAIIGMEAIDDLHDLHVWSLSSDVTLLSAHLVMAGHPTLEQAQAVAGDVRARLAGDFGISHATLELECESCDDGGTPGPCSV
jgi:cobalt-zinc-cadmium efflux system protein